MRALKIIIGLIHTSVIFQKQAVISIVERVKGGRVYKLEMVQSFSVFANDTFSAILIMTLQGKHSP